MSFVSPQVLVVGLLLSLTTLACSSTSSQSSGTPTSPTAGPPVLSLQQDTQAPVGEAVWLTLASRGEEAGKISVAVSTSNVLNQQSTSVGFFAIVGRLKWDASLLEVDGFGMGDLMGGNTGANGGHLSNVPPEPGRFVFGAQRIDNMRVQGTGELFLLRLRPVSGVTSGTTRIDLEPFIANERAQVGAPPYSTQLQLVPFSSRGNVLENVYGATITIRPGG